jgi:hypothetical protein
MHDDERLMMNRVAREIHAITYFKHVTGASEAAIRRAMEKFGSDRSKSERELRRHPILDDRDSNTTRSRSAEESGLNDEWKSQCLSKR